MTVFSDSRCTQDRTSGVTKMRSKSVKYTSTIIIAAVFHTLGLISESCDLRITWVAQLPSEAQGSMPSSWGQLSLPVVATWSPLPCSESITTHLLYNGRPHTQRYFQRIGHIPSKNANRKKKFKKRHNWNKLLLLLDMI